MSRRESARRSTSATAARPTKRARAVKKAERESGFPARIADATPEEIARAMFASRHAQKGGKLTAVQADLLS